jgi:hypothetical protein
MNSIILPIEVPKFQTIPSFTIALGVLYANNKVFADYWVVNNCLSVRFHE